MNHDRVCVVRAEHMMHTLRQMQYKLYILFSGLFSIVLNVRMYENNFVVVHLNVIQISNSISGGDCILGK